MKKRVLAALLALVMLFGMLPMSVFAENVDVGLNDTGDNEAVGYDTGDGNDESVNSDEPNGQPPTSGTVVFTCPTCNMTRTETVDNLWTVTIDPTDATKATAKFRAGAAFTLSDYVDENISGHEFDQCHGGDDITWSWSASDSAWKANGNATITTKLRHSGGSTAPTGKPAALSETHYFTLNCNTPGCTAHSETPLSTIFGNMYRRVDTGDDSVYTIEFVPDKVNEELSYSNHQLREASSGLKIDPMRITWKWENGEWKGTSTACDSTGWPFYVYAYVESTASSGTDEPGDKTPDLDDMGVLVWCIGKEDGSEDGHKTKKITYKLNALSYTGSAKKQGETWKYSVTIDWDSILDKFNTTGVGVNHKKSGAYPKDGTITWTWKNSAWELDETHEVDGINYLALMRVLYDDSAAVPDHPDDLEQYKLYFRFVCTDSTHKHNGGYSDELGTLTILYGANSTYGLWDATKTEDTYTVTINKVGLEKYMAMSGNGMDTANHEVETIAPATLEWKLKNNAWVYQGEKTEYKGEKAIVVNVNAKAKVVEAPVPTEELLSKGSFSIASVYCGYPVEKTPHNPRVMECRAVNYIKGSFVENSAVKNADGTYTVQIKTAPYVDYFNNQVYVNYKCPHEAKTETVSVTLAYTPDGKLSKWEVVTVNGEKQRADIPVYCEKAPEKPTADEVKAALGNVTVSCVNPAAAAGSNCNDCVYGAAGGNSIDYNSLQRVTDTQYTIEIGAEAFVGGYSKRATVEHHLASKETLTWVLNYKDGKWVGTPKEKDVDDRIFVTHEPKTAQEIGLIAPDKHIESTCETSTRYAAYGLTSAFVYYDTDVTTTYDEAAKAYVSVIKTDKYVDAIKKDCDKLTGETRAHKLTSGNPTVTWKFSVASVTVEDGKIKATWTAEPATEADGKITVKCEPVYTITYNWRGVVKPTDVRNVNNPETFTADELPITLKAPDFKNNEWPQKFLNWRDAAGNVVTQITEPGNVELYAYYQFPVQYTVYDENDQKVDELSVTEWYNEDDFADYRLRSGEKTGHDFDGWYQTKKDFGNTNKRVTELYTAKKWELVGKLTRKEYNVSASLYLNGTGTGTTRSVKGLFGDPINYKGEDGLEAQLKAAALAADAANEPNQEKVDINICLNDKSGKPFDATTYGQEGYNWRNMEWTNPKDGQTRKWIVAYTWAYVSTYYDVTFMDGETELGTETVKCGETANFADPTKYGYNFTGWYTAAEGGDKVELTTPVTKSMTLYAQWDKKEYNVSASLYLNGNGTGTTRSVKGLYDTDINYDGEDGLKAQLKEAALAADAANEPNQDKVDIEICLNDKSGKPFDATTYGQEGYNWRNMEWTNPKDGQTRKWIVAYTWAYVSTYYDVTFMDGETELGTETVKCNETANEPTAPTKEGYKFLGWFKDGEDTAFDFATPITQKTELTARWEKLYKIIYHGNGGLLVKDGKTFDHVTSAWLEPGQPTNLKDGVFTREHYTFTGWATSADGEKAYDAKQHNVIFPDTVFDADGNVHLYAAWTAVEYLISVDYRLKDDPAGGNVWVATIKGTVEDDLIVKLKNEITAAMIENQLAKKDLTETFAGYTPNFDHWFYASDKSEIPAGTMAIPTGRLPEPNLIMVYLKGTPNEYTVTFDPNGGEVEPTSKTVTFDDTYGELPTPTRTNYNFKGWYLNSTKITADTVVKTAENHTLKAAWSRNYYALTINYVDKKGKTVADSYEASVALGADFSVTSPSVKGYKLEDKDDAVIEGTMPGYDLTIKVVYIKKSTGGGSGTIDSPNKPTTKAPALTLNTDDHFAFINGYPDGSVQPEGNVTRAETAAILYRIMGDECQSYYKTNSSSYSDVARGDWYNTYVATLENAGVIVDTRTNGKFRPNDAITRAELASMIAQFAGLESASAAKFNDVGSRYWAAEEIAIAAKVGWINGYPDGSFRPDRNVTRAELMAMVNRALGRTPKSEDDLLSGMKTWRDNANVNAWYYLDVQEATNDHTYTKSGTHETWKKLL